MKNYKYGLVLAFFGILLGTRAAHADPTAPPPACLVKGDRCYEAGKDGVCVDAICTSAPDGGLNPNCPLVCDTSGAGAAGGAGTGGGLGLGGDSPTGGVVGTAGANGGGLGVAGDISTGTAGAPSAGATATGGSASAGAAGTSNSAGATNLAGNAGDPTGGAESAGCSCSVGSLGSEHNVAAFMLSIGSVAFAVSRRRRRE